MTDVDTAAWRRMADALGHAPTREGFLRALDALDAANAKLADAYRQNEMLLKLNGPLVAGGAEWKTRAEKAEQRATDYQAALEQIRDAEAVGLSNIARFVLDKHAETDQ